MLGYSDYLMIISPPDDLKKEINRYKRASVNLIGHFESMHSTAHITITYQTRCKPYLIQPSVLMMEKRLSSVPPVELQINGFDFFNHGKSAKTIYAVVEINIKTDNWFKLLKMEMGIILCRILQLPAIFLCHLLINFGLILKIGHLQRRLMPTA